MIHKKAFSQMTKKILRRQAGLHDYQIMHPSRDWIIGLCFASAVFLVGAAMSAQLYFSNSNTTLVMDGSVEEVVVYRESLVEAALKQLQERDAIYQKLQLSSRGVTPDPLPSPVVATSSPLQVVEEVATTTEVIAPPIDAAVVPAPL